LCKVTAALSTFDFPVHKASVTEKAAPEPDRRPRKTGRRAGQLFYYGLCVAIAASGSWQITRQVFFERPAEPPPWSTCDEGLRALYRAIGAARAAAEQEASDEAEAALRRFREVAGQAWRFRDAVSESCSASPDRTALLDAMEQLRYSEEHDVRHQAAELAARRRRVRQQVAQTLGEDAASER
jgi:hypothetical protein